MENNTVHFYEREKTVVLIDGVNLYVASKALGFDIDYKKLLDFFRSKCHLVRAVYFTIVAEDNEYLAVRPLIDWLAYNGYAVITKPTRDPVDAMGRRKIRGNVDLELTIEAMRLAPRVDHIVLFASDGDLRGLISALQQEGRRVTVISTIKTQPAVVADDVRRQADQFIDLVDIQSYITR